MREPELPTLATRAAERAKKMPETGEIPGPARRLKVSGGERCHLTPTLRAEQETEKNAQVPGL